MYSTPKSSGSVAGDMYIDTQNLCRTLHFLGIHSADPEISWASFLWRGFVSRNIHYYAFF